MTLSVRALAAIVYGMLLLPAFAQYSDRLGSGLYPVCDGKFGLCRYIDRTTRTEVIPARFERALEFSEGLAAVRIDGRFGYIDHRGEVVIPPRFELGGEFYLGLAEVVVGENVGVINRQGELVVPPVFQRAIPLTKDVFLTAEGKWTHGRNETTSRPLPRWDVSGKARFGLYHIAGHWIRRPDLTRFVKFDEEGRGLIWATVGSPATGPFGLLASTGEWVVEPQYQRVGMLRDERAVVAKSVGGVLQFGALDPAGQLVVPFQPLELLGWSNGWGAARQDWRGKDALLDRSGAMIGNRFFDRVEWPVVGDIAEVWIDGRAMGLDRAGNIMPHPRNGRVLSQCSSGIRVVEMEGKIQITGANGRPTAPYLFEQLNGPLPCDRPYMIRLDTKWGFVGLDGRLLQDPPAFEEAQVFGAGYAAVKQGGRWGIIDTTGRFVFDPKFDQYHGSLENLFHFERDGRRFWLDLNGEERPAPPEPPPPQTSRARALDCKHGLRIVERGGQWGIADADGTEVIAPDHRAITCFQSGLVWVPVDSKREWCAMGRDGALRLNECRRIHYPYVHMHAHPEVFHADPFENSVLWTRAFLEFGMGRRATRPEWIYSPPPTYPQ